MSALDAFEQHLVDEQIILLDDLSHFKHQAQEQNCSLLECLNSAPSVEHTSLYHCLAQYCELPFISSSIQLKSPLI
jgi:hypothetical protein